jgi:uncharacterized protein YbjT (DUF2867 family)
MILVTGAAGLNGGELVRRLSARGVALRAFVRSVEKAAALSALPNVEVFAGDMARPETLSGALRGVDRAMLISSSDSAMLEVQSAFIAAAASAGVKHVVKLSGIMPELDSPFRFARMHGEIERRLEASGMAFTHLRAGEFMPAYFRQVPSKVADALSAATGKSIRYVNVAPDDAKNAQLAAGVPPYLADALAELFAERRKGKEAQVSPVAQTLLGRRPTSFAEFAVRNAAIFRGEQPAPKI